MDLIVQLIVAAAGGFAAHAGRNIYDWVKQYLNEAFKDKSENEVRLTLEAIGNLSDGDIRKRVAELTRLKKLTTQQAEDLAALLINLAHGARFHSTHGTLRSSFVRCGPLLDQLLSRVLPKRRKDDPVAENNMRGWKLARFLGMGTFGEVWEVVNPHHPERRAVKFFTSPDAQQWVKAEQKNLFEVKSRLPSHPNLISFLDVDLSARPFPYLVLEYANGGSLEEWILSHESDRLKLDKRRLIESVVRGLSAAHQKDIAHRDLKPANILLSVTGKDVVPKIADFGLGRVETQRAEISSERSQGVVVGTTMYLPPEALQLFAKRSAEQDDVFAVGVIWYQLLVGRLERPPYDFAERLREHLADSQTIRVIERCLAQPGRRFPDAAELEQELECLPLLQDWEPPPDCFDVQHLCREYLTSRA